MRVWAIAKLAVHDPQVPPMPAEETRVILEAELGLRLANIFEWIDLDRPLGSASISQVLCTNCIYFWLRVWFRVYSRYHQIAPESSTDGRCMPCPGLHSRGLKRRRSGMMQRHGLGTQATALWAPLPGWGGVAAHLNCKPALPCALSSGRRVVLQAAPRHKGKSWSKWRVQEERARWRSQA